MKVKHSIQTAIEDLELPKLRKFQIEPINDILDHQDTMVIAPTGSGKSAIFQIPAVINGKKGK